MFKRIGTIWLVVAGLLLVVFAIGLVVGWFLPADLKLTLINSVLVKFEAILSRSTSDTLLALNIFLNNLLVALIILVSAIIPLIPIVIIFANGALIGVFGELLLRLDYVQPGTFYSAVISLVPHGIFELSAIFLSGSLGLVAFIKLVAPHTIKPDKTRGQFLLFTAKWFIAVIIPLLFVAGIVEAFVSPRVAEALLSDTNSAVTSPYAVSLDPLTLAQTNCIPGEPSSLASVSSDQLSLLYDPTVASILEARAKVPQWQTTYTCADGGWFSVASFAREQWSPEQAYQLIIAMLDHLEANYTEPYELVVDTKLSGLSLRYQVWELPGRTIVITQTDLPFTPRTLFSTPTGQ